MFIWHYALSFVVMTDAPELPELTADNWLDGLDNREAKFVQLYCASLNVRQSAIEAGYEPTTAHVKSYGWVSKSACTKPHVLRAIEFDLRRRAAEELVTKDMVIRRMKAIAFLDPRKAAKFRAHKVVIEDEVDEANGETRLVVRETTTNTVEIVDSDAIDDDTAFAIKEISQDKDGNVRLKFHDSRAALADLGKHLGIMDDRVRHLGPDGGPVRVISADMKAKEAAEAFKSMLDGD